MSSSNSDDGKPDVLPIDDSGQPKSFPPRLMLLLAMTSVMILLSAWIGRPVLRAVFSIFSFSDMSYFGFAVRGSTLISLVLFGILTKSVLEDQRRRGRSFFTGTCISLVLWSVLAGTWLVLGLMSLFADNPQNGFRRETVAPVEATAVVLVLLGIVLVPPGIGFLRDRRSRMRVVE